MTLWLFFEENRMNLLELYPSSFDGSFEDYRAFMRSVLIKGS